MEKITLKNDFHNTEAAVIPKTGGYVTKSQARRIKKTLCGIRGCLCGGVLGERGPQQGGLEVHPVSGIMGDFMAAKLVSQQEV